jgi:hypothetical protein
MGIQLSSASLLFAKLAIKICKGVFQLRDFLGLSFNLLTTTANEFSL